MTAWDLVRQGMWHFHKVTKEGHHSARALFRRACGIDPDLPESHIWLGRVSAGIIAYGWSAEPDADGREGTDAATRAGTRSARSYAHYAFAIVSAYAGSASAAACAAQTAIGLNPSFTLGHLVLGMSRLFDGEPQRAIVPLAHDLRLNPNDPQNLVRFNLLAYAQLLAGEPGNALESANRALTVRPVFRPTFEVLACCAVALGQLDDARIWAARVKSLDGPASHFIAPLRRNHADCDAQIARMLNWQARS